MIQHISKQIKFTAFLLSLLAGSINAVGLLGFSNQAVSHITGTVSLLSLAFVNQEYALLLHLFFILLSFLLGSILSGYIISTGAFIIGKKYGIILFIESFLIFIAIYFLNLHFFIGHYWISMACGLQNAMISTYSGALIRTTHLTGLFTDIGLILGRYLRGEKTDAKRVKLYLFIIFGFILGSMSGAYLYNIYAVNALYFPACLALFLGVSYQIYLYRK